MHATIQQLPATASPLLELTHRLLGEHAAKVRFESAGREDAFEWMPDGDGVIIRAAGPLEQARALHDYLCEACDAHLGWAGKRLTLPPKPLPPGIRRRKSPFRYRHYMNQVTFAYTTAWWDWPRWQREIDWMALHGINLPLLAIGQEAAWRATWRELGLSDDALQRYWTGAAYLPFHRMGCIDTHAGPLPQRWIDQQAELATKVLERMRAYGMTPVLSAFAGHVPQELRDIAPRSRIVQLEPWSEFDHGTWYLQPTDPLFAEVQRIFLTHQTERFGTDHYYAADPFIEMPPTSSDPHELGQLAAGILSSMTQVDAEAHWVLQAWPFQFMKRFWGPEQVRGFINGIPDGRLLMLDLACDHIELWREHESFCGKPWLWCTAEIFGARAGSAMYGRLDRLAHQPAIALHAADRGKLRGIGLVWEAIGENDLTADLFAERAWHDGAIDTSEWLGQWVRRRYGADVPAAAEAWRLLHQTLYNAPVANLTCPYPLVCVRPDSVAKRPTTDWYPPQQLADAAKHLLAAADRLGGSEIYRNDVVQVVLRALLDVGDRHVRGVLSAAQQCERDDIKRHGEALLGVIAAAERLAHTHPALLMGRWIEDARAWGDDAGERDNLELNARMLVTTWGGPILADYACKPWAGLFDSFYRHRWSRCIDAAIESCGRGAPLDLAALGRELAEWEQQWVRQTTPLPSTPAGDAIEAARTILRRWFC